MFMCMTYQHLREAIFYVMVDLNLYLFILQPFLSNIYIYIPQSVMSNHFKVISP